MGVKLPFFSTVLIATLLAVAVNTAVMVTLVSRLTPQEATGGVGGPLRVRVVALNTFYNYVVGFTGDVVFDGYASAVLVAPGEVCVVGNATLCVLQGEVPAPACFRNALNTTVVLFALTESREHPSLYEAYALRALKPGAEDCVLAPRRAVLSIAKP